MFRFLLHLLSIAIVNWFLLYSVVRYFPEFGLEIQVPSLLLGYLVLWAIFWFFYEVVRNVLKIFSFPLAFLTMWLSTVFINVLIFYLFAYVVNNYLVLNYSWFGVVLGTIWQTFILSVVLFFVMRVVHFIISKII